MSRGIGTIDVVTPEVKRGDQLPLETPASFSERILGLLPVIAPIALALVFIFSRLKFGEHAFLYEGALTLLALICYISASVLLVTNLFVKENVLDRLGLMTVGLGYSFGLAGWMIRWIEAGDKEGWLPGKLWRYFPLDNLYALTLGFCCGAALATLVIIRKPKYRALGALSMPIVSVILTLAICLGNEIRTLQPILDSYWRPIHVSIATLAYGVCLTSFGIAFAYLLKDGIRMDAVAIWVGLFGLLVFGTVGRFGVLTHLEYGASLFWVTNKESLDVRSPLPGVGPLMVLTLLATIGFLLCFAINWQKRDQETAKWGWRLFGAATVLQLLVLLVLFYQIRTVQDPASRIPQREMVGFGGWLQDQMKENTPPALTRAQLAQAWLEPKSREMIVNFNSDPVEFGALIGLFVALLMVGLIAWRRETVMTALPPITSLDSLLYRTVGVAFPLLSMLLITGAVWANESWGRYWGWDSKEVGALVSWMAYAGYLHTRIAHGWRGRRSAYFALLGFVLVIFTWLGVSYLLPGLHSYAGV
jgi:ABC-type transport system involved in cytochrome c biogenesis permease subunit